MSQPTHSTFSQPFMLPHFDCEVPLLVGPDGLHYVPIFLLCRLLGLNATGELHRAQHHLLWSSAALLPLTLAERGRECMAWCFPYPLAIGYWLSQVSTRVRDPRRRAQITRTVDDAMEINALAERQVRGQFEAGRRRMYQLIPRLEQLRAHAQVLARRAATDPSHRSRRRLEALVRYATAAAEEVEGFVRAWIAAAAGLPVLDAIQVDPAGNVLDEVVPFSMFAVLKREDAAQLDAYERLITHLLGEVTHWSDL